MLLIPTFLCPKSWEKMSGDETQRFCTYCKKHVHNLEALSVNERLTLLSSPAASVCSRYRFAIRRPARGKEQSYLRHLAKYGAGVAVTGSVLLVLWEMHDQTERNRYYRAAAPHPKACTTYTPMPKECYEELQTVTMGRMAIVPQPAKEVMYGLEKPGVPSHVDLQLDPAEVDRLLEQSKPVISPPPPAPMNR